MIWHLVDELDPLVCSECQSSGKSSPQNRLDAIGLGARLELDPKLIQLVAEKYHIRESEARRKIECELLFDCSEDAVAHLLAQSDEEEKRPN